MLVFDEVDFVGRVAREFSEDGEVGDGQVRLVHYNFWRLKGVGGMGCIGDMGAVEVVVFLNGEGDGGWGTGFYLMV